ncbi:hypothetical protein D3C80_1245270 [compost metagenome]
MDRCKLLKGRLLLRLQRILSQNEIGRNLPQHLQIGLPVLVAAVSADMDGNFIAVVPVIVLRPLGMECRRIRHQIQWKQLPQQ